jgi:glycosyltransferase involved in cell wall biosynthesis
MKILFVDQFSEIGGAQRCLLDLLPGIRQRGWTAHAAVPGNGPVVAALRSGGATVHSIRCGPYENGHKSAGDMMRFAVDSPTLARRIGALAEQLGPDLIYVNGPRVLPPAAWAARGRVPLLFHSHSRLTPRYAAVLAGNALRLANATAVACCRYVTGPIEGYVPSDRLHVVYNGVADCLPGPRTTRNEGPWRIGILGRISPEKGQAEFVEAARILVNAGAPCQFVVCGAPVFADASYLDLVKQMAEYLPVEFLGWREDISTALSRMDLLAVPSNAREPGAPRVILEAYSAGVPVVAFRSGGIPEIVSHGRTGMLTDAPTSAALARAIQELVASPQRLTAMADAARADWRERYTVERYRNEILDLAERVTSRTVPAEARTAAPR